MRPEFFFTVSRRSYREELCDKADCAAICQALDALKQKYRAKADIDYFDYEDHPLPTSQTQQKIDELGGRSDGIIMLVERELGEEQLRGFLEYKKFREIRDGQIREKGKSDIRLPKWFIFIKKETYATREEFKSFRDSIKKQGVDEDMTMFQNAPELKEVLGKRLNSFVEGRIPKRSWIPGAVAAAVLAFVAAWALMTFGPRIGEPGGTRPGQQVEKVAGGDGDSLEPAETDPEVVPQEVVPEHPHKPDPGETAVTPGGPSADRGTGPGPGGRAPAPAIGWTDEQKLAKGLVYVSARGRTLSGEAYDSFGSRIRGMVTSAGLTRTDDRGKALWVIEVTGKARKYNEEDGFYFSYVDIDLDVMNAVSGEAVHSGTLVVPGAGREGVKGGSAKSFEDAVEKAYMKAYPLIEEEIKRINDH